MKKTTKEIISMVAGGGFGLATFFLSSRRIPDYSQEVEARNVLKSPDDASNILGKMTLQSCIDLLHAFLVAGGAIIGWGSTRLVLNKFFPSEDVNENINIKPLNETGKDENTPEKRRTDSMEWRGKIKAASSLNQSEGQTNPRSLHV